MERRVIAIAGPTCSGKSDIAFQLAKKIQTEIVSADSRQIYKELTIGTAKPPQAYLNEIRHHFINHISITNSYDVGKYSTEAIQIIERIFSQHKIPIVVGGSGLYINSLLYGIFEGPSADIKVRKKLENELLEKGIDFLFEKLKKVDEKTAEKIDRENPRRIIRALEVFEISGRPISQLQSEKPIKRNYDFHIIGINWNRKILYERINRRVDSMMKDGLVDEVEEVLSFGIDKNLNALQTVGYKEVIDFLERKINYEEMIELIKRNTRRYVKRQMTWFKKDKNIKWLDVGDNLEIDLMVERIMKEIVGI